MGDFSDFQRGQIVDAHLAGASGNSGQKPKLGARDRHTLKGIVSTNHKCAAAKVTAELHIHLEDRFHKNSLMRALQIQQHSW